ncbi:ral guanine nucleotide dissociation stimulator-like isoform X6 [Canis lupus familiaris]|uniref:ral guanine nucleotide dissociation stimulator-like isoform X3 n=1 Tax=Canis lupus dingo TaxID=286419 RepID=UPI000DC6CD21|nr:ral guanine nucleotide dissociation stimulator-like isoform X3 [Canis lupus dingo]XP_038444805.1 ral guanine nucleotide dissociation stimulator-like isoform X4 [Canis lupus familiaris]XP_038445016.1 ral guanine nucleotide dissociation stimulator-like isoform X2 [Canis lupus familiaris]XP_038445018.1 ral guanine nucleotide dissociation stimulator-like isoform X1 [Canis lupus familiaris]XP_038445020.1 ral guanine nucleotide dissociation stimulator-like isoform X2 [Canis lupus familiaris]XP_03
MFSCCRPTSGGSGSQEPQGCRLFQCCRLWLQHKNQRLRAFIRRRRQGARASAGKAPPICPTKPSRTELLEQEFQQLLPALLRRDVISVFIFLDNCHGFATTDEVLDLLFTKYGCIAAACGGDDAVLQRWKLAICCILEIWMDYYQEDFCRLPQSASLKKILEFIRQRMPGTDVELRARRYLQQLRRLHAAEPEAGATASARAKDPEALPEPAPAPTVGPAASDGPEVLEAALAAGAEGLAPAEVPAGEAKPLQIVVTALDHGCALDEPRAPAATPEEEQALAPAIGVPRVPEPPIASGTTGFNLCAAP